MAQFVINGIEYRSDKMLPMAQAAVIKRLLPVFANYATLKGLVDTVLRRRPAAEAEAGAAGDAPASVGEAQAPEAAKETTNDALLHALAGMANAFAAMSDADQIFIFEKVLSLCSRKSGQGFAKIWNSGAGQANFGDIDLVVMLAICKEVLAAELTPFLASGGFSLFAGLLR